MWILFITTTLIVPLILCFVFSLIGKKGEWEKESTSSFECGFSSYFFSRFSFSIHYFIVGLIFLFLDLELCFLMPLFLESPSALMIFLIFMFTGGLLAGLLEEWAEGKLEWIY